MTDSPITPPATPSPSSTPAPPPPAPRVTAPSLRVRQPVSRAPRPTPSATTENPDDAGEIGADDPVDTAPTPTPSYEPVKLDRAALSDIARAFVFSISLFLHSRLAVLPEEQANDLWIASEGDQGQIGDPLGKIAMRHGAPETTSPDAADLIMAGIGLVAYVTRNIVAASSFRIRRRRARTVDVPATQGETP